MRRSSATGEKLSRIEASLDRSRAEPTFSWTDVDKLGQLPQLEFSRGVASFRAPESVCVRAGLFLREKEKAEAAYKPRRMT